MLKSVRMFEAIPGTGIMCAEQGEMPHDDACAKYLASEPRFRRGPLDPTLMPEQSLRNKLAKSMGWSVVKSVYDRKNEKYAFEVMINAQTTEWRFLTNEEVCKSMHWKSFKFENDHMNVRFVDDPSWYEPLPAKPAKKAGKRGRKAKASK